MEYKIMKTINFSGSYIIHFIDSDPKVMVMRLEVGDAREFIITLTLDSLTISIVKTYYFNNYLESHGIDLYWIPKYMLRPNKWGKEIFNTNPEFILKLWTLVADKKQLYKLKNVKKREITVEFVK